jgi:hypothetical protein
MTPTLKKYALIGGVSLAALGGAYAIGRYTVPSKIDKKTEYVQVQDVSKISQLQAQVTALSTQLDTAHTASDVLRKQLETLRLHQKVTVHKVTHPDGTIDETDTTDTHVNQTTSSTDQGHTDSTQQHQGTQQTSSTTQQTTSETSHTSTTSTTEKTITFEKPQWHLNLEAGFNLSAMSFKNGLNTGPLVFDGSIQRRIIGPFFFGPGLEYDQHWILKASIGADF